MSSILDALKKLEEEKTQLETDPDDIEVNVDDARYDLVGRSVMGDRIEVRFKPVTLIGAAAGFAVLLVMVSVLFSVSLTRGKDEGTAVVAQPAEVGAGGVSAAGMLTEDSGVEEVLAVEREAGAAGDVDAAASGDEAEGGGVQRDETGQPKPDVKAAWGAGETAVPRSTPRAAARGGSVEPPTPERSEARVVAPPRVVPITAVAELPPPVAEGPAAVVESPVVAPAAEAVDETSVPASRAPLDVDVVAEQLAQARAQLRSDGGSGTMATVDRAPVEYAPAAPAAPRRLVARELPILSQSAMARHDLGNMIVNIVSPATDQKPTASAVINRMKVFEGERITGSRARLLQVESNGVVIEIAGSGERYFLPH